MAQITKLGTNFSCWAGFKECFADCRVVETNDAPSVKQAPVVRGAADGPMSDSIPYIHASANVKLETWHMEPNIT